MKITFLYNLMIVLSLIHQNTAFAQTDITAKAVNEKQFHASAPAAVIVNFNATLNNERILLNWTLDKNQVVDQIEVERSTDEKTFAMAGLVFGTDQPDKVEYLFYEKKKGRKIFYRLRIISKDRTFTYSSIISPEPATVKP